jgi:hypothetical protein
MHYLSLCSIILQAFLLPSKGTERKQYAAPEPLGGWGSRNGQGRVGSLFVNLRGKIFISYEGREDLTFAPVIPMMITN